MSLVIAFAGPATHGKTTCSRLAEAYLVSQGFKVKIVSFADRLKEVCKIIFRLTDKDVNNEIAKASVRKHIGTTPRAIMQKFGTEICRDGIKEHLPTIANDTIWTWNVEQDIRELTRENVIVIISDLRFEDEKEMLMRYKSLLINVVKPASPIFGSPPDQSLHISEQGLDLDYTIVNDIMNDNYTSLNNKIQELIEMFMEKCAPPSVVDDQAK
jgi:hypothetical protein